MRLNLSPLSAVSPVDVSPNVVAVGVSADELRHRLHGHLGAEFQQALIDWCREGVVDAQDGPGLPWRAQIASSRPP